MQIRDIVDSKKEKTPLTQIDIITQNDPTSMVTITTKESIEPVIMARNQRHSWQSLQTPFATDPLLSTAIDSNYPDNKIEEIIQGTFLSEMRMTLI